MQMLNPAIILLRLLMIPIDSVSWIMFRWMLREELNLRVFGRIRFFGNNEFLRVADDALKEIERMDPDMYADLMDSRVTLVSEWRNYRIAGMFGSRYTIEQWLVDEGVDGMIFAIVAYYSQYRLSLRNGWFKNLVLKPDRRIFESLEFAIDWLREHSYTEESIGVLEQIWQRRMFGHGRNVAYQDTSDNADKPHV